MAKHHFDSTKLWHVLRAFTVIKPSESKSFVLEPQFCVEVPVFPHNKASINQFGMKPKDINGCFCHFNNWAWHNMRLFFLFFHFLWTIFIAVAPSTKCMYSIFRYDHLCSSVTSVLERSCTETQSISD